MVDDPDLALPVALRKESVDRNWRLSPWYGGHCPSLSARRAWIEIEYTLYCPPFGEVALRKESVDRNADVVSVQYGREVALRKESVDRNKQPSVPWPAALRRSPQGERG